MKNITILYEDKHALQAINQAIYGFNKICSIYKLDFNFSLQSIGEKSIEENGFPISKETIQTCKNSDAILCPNINYDINSIQAPQLIAYNGFETLKNTLNLNIQLTNIKPYEKLLNPFFNPEQLQNSDILFIKINNIENENTLAKAEEYYTSNHTLHKEKQVEELVQLAFQNALKRKRRIHCALRKNLNATNYFKKIFTKYSYDYKQVELCFINVDDCAYELLKNPKQFDIIATDNMFGDILIKEASFLVISKGMISDSYFGNINLYTYNFDSHLLENSQNPISLFLSFANMLLYTFNNKLAFDNIQRAIKKVLQKGYRTYDIYTRSGFEILSTTTKTTNAIIDEIK